MALQQPRTKCQQMEIKREKETQLWRRLGEMCCSSCFLSDTCGRVSELMTDRESQVLLWNYHFLIPVMMPGTCELLQNKVSLNVSQN